MVEVARRLQEALYSLTLLGHDEMTRTAVAHSKLAVSYAERALKLPEELEAVQSAAGPRH